MSNLDSLIGDFGAPDPGVYGPAIPPAALPMGIGGAASGAAGGAAGFAGMLGPLGMASTALGAVSSAIGGITSFVSGEQQAKEAQKAAQQASITGGISAQEALLHGMATTGRAATLAAASGGGLGGTTAGVLNQLAERSMFNARAASYRGATQADADRYMASVDKDNAINALIGGFTGAAGQAVGGALKQSFRQNLLNAKTPVDPMAFAYMQ
jgi:hypothetical protein